MRLLVLPSPTINRSCTETFDGLVMANVLRNLGACAMEKFRTLASPKVLALGNEKKNKFSFCISLVFSYL
jgi:hypothetical protein